MSTEQVEPLETLSATQEQIIAICDTPRRLAELLATTGMTNRGHFKTRQLDPLLQGGVLRMTHPEQRNHPRQAYVLTEAGLALKAHGACHAEREVPPSNGDDRDGP